MGGVMKKRLLNWEMGDLVLPLTPCSLRQLSYLFWFSVYSQTLLHLVFTTLCKVSVLLPLTKK